MRRLLAALVAGSGWLVPALAAQPTVKVVATEPATDAILGRDETFYIRMEYTADAVPIALLLFAIGRVVVGTVLDPTSHNLWPFEIGMFALAGLAMIGVLALMRLISGAGRD